MIWLIIILVVLVTVFIVWHLIGKYFQRRYYEENYRPQWLKEDDIGDFPQSYQVKNVPWISYERQYCQATTIQMIAYKNGVKASRDYINFLMGHTYGALYFGKLDIWPGTDPEPGAEAAAPYLGLKRNYLVTNEAQLFIKAIKFYLSKDIPVRVALNYATLVGETGFSPHSELLVGYDSKGFFYYETVGEDKWTENKKGLRIDEQTLINAVKSVSDVFKLPWKFQLTIYEKHKKEKNFHKIWKRNGELLIGAKHGPYILSGSLAIMRFASDLKKLGAKVTDWQVIENMLEMFSYSRFDNANFLKEHFVGDKEVEKAAQKLEEAGKCYGEALKILKKGGEINEVANLLFKAASLEKEAGQIFISKSKVVLDATVNESK